MGVNFNFLPEESKALAKQAFDVSAAPLQEAFTKQLETQEETLAKRGIAFGGLGRNLRQETLKTQQEQLGQLAGRIGVGLGQQSIQQAFQAAEAAKSREFQSGEAVLDRALQKELLGQQLTADEQRLLQQQQFQAGESELERQLRTGLQESQQQFQAGESSLERALRENMQAEQISAQEAAQTSSQKFQAGQSALARALETQRLAQQQTQFESAQQFQAEQNLLNRDLETELQQGRITAQEASQLSQQQFQAEQNLLNREFETELQAASREFESGERALDRDLQFQLQNGQIDAQQAILTQTQRFEEQQSNLNRELQSQLQQGLIDANMAQLMAQQNFTAQQARDQRDLNLIQTGALTGDAANEVIGRLFGVDSANFQTNEQIAIAQAARNSGLNVADFEKMRSIIGESQMAAIIDNPELFIDDPQRNLELNMMSAGLSSGDEMTMAVSALSMLKEGYISESAARSILTPLEEEFKYRDYKTLNERFNEFVNVENKEFDVEGGA